MRVQYIPRDDFVENYFDFTPGEHVQIISTTGGGKTELAGRLAEVTLARYPDLDYVSLMPKKADSTTSHWIKRLGLGETDVWPPKKKILEKNNNRHVFWPKHIKDDEAANKTHLGHEFGKVLNHTYWSENDSITFVDDAYLIGVHYGLNDLLDRHWIAGRSNGSSLWTSLQKPSGTRSGSISSFGYDSPTHIFIGRDNDQRNLDRIAEISISQLDPREVMELVKSLPVHKFGNSAVSEMLYINRSGPYMCQVGI